MPTIDESSLLESILPMPFVTKVTLETRDDNGNHINQVGNNNPHVQEINNMNSSAQGTKNLASVNTILKDYSFNNNMLPPKIAGNNTKSTEGKQWDDLDPKNYFSLTMFAVSNPQELQKVSNEAFIKNYIRLASFSNALTETYGGTDASIHIPNHQDKVRTISLKETKDNTSGENAVKVLKKYITNDPKTNMQIYNIPYETDIFFETDLHLVTFIHINYKDLLDGALLGQSIQLPESSIVYSRLSIDSLVVNGKANNTKTVFFRGDRQDEIWNGDYQVNVNGVFFHPGAVNAAINKVPYYVNKIETEAGVKSNSITKNIIGYRTYPVDGQSYPLNKKDISNNIVSDLRNIDRLEPTSLDFKSLENDVFSFLKYNVTKDNITLNAGSSYISDLMMTSDKTGVNKLIFSINFRKLIRDNSLFSSFLDADSGTATTHSIINNSPIYSLKVTRRRVKEKAIDNRAASVGAVKSNYQRPNRYETEENEIPNVIVTSKDTDTSKPVIIEKINKVYKTLEVASTINGPNNMFKTLETVGHIKELTDVAIISSGNNIGVRHFAVTDLSAANITGGEYQYSVELTIKNGVAEHLQLLISGFKEHKLALEKYYNLAVGASVSAGKTNNNYDVLYQKFTDTFKQKLSGIIDENGVNLHTRANNSILAFSNLLQIFYSSATRGKNFKTKQFGAAEKTALQQQLLSLCNTTTGSPRGIETTLGIMDTFLDTMSTFMGGSVLSNKQGTSSEASNPGASKASNQKMIIFNHDFNTLFKTSSSRHMGYDCISTANKPPIGVTPSKLNSEILTNTIRTMTLADMDLRSKEENYKFFVPNSLGYAPNTQALEYNFDLEVIYKVDDMDTLTTGPDSDPETRAYSYLTPSYIYMPGKEQSSVLKNIAAIDSNRLAYDLSLAQRYEKYKKTLLQIVKSNISKYNVGAASYAVTKEYSQVPGANHSISTDKAEENIKNLFEIRNIMASENCTIAKFDEGIKTYKDHNEIIKSTKDKVKLVKIQAELEAGGSSPENLLENKFILEGEDYDIHGNFILKLEKTLPLILGENALKLTLMKSLLPTEHLVNKQREGINLYNISDVNSYLHSWIKIYLNNTNYGSLVSKISNLPNQIKSLIQSASAIDGLSPGAKPWATSGVDDGSAPYNDLALYAYYYFNYKNIFRVEALTGYSNNGDVVSPVWETVTSDLLTGLFEEGNNVFCRLVRWTDPVFNATDFSEEHPTHMALYDQYFVINNSSVVTNPTGGIDIEAQNLEASILDTSFNDPSTTGSPMVLPGQANLEAGTQDLTTSTPSSDDGLDNQPVNPQLLDY